MNNNHRDLLLMLNHELMSQKAYELEVTRLHELLYNIECTENVAKACELIDLNKYKIIKSTAGVKNFLRSREKRAFVFVNNRN